MDQTTDRAVQMAMYQGKISTHSPNTTSSAERMIHIILIQQILFELVPWWSFELIKNQYMCAAAYQNDNRLLPSESW